MLFESSLIFIQPEFDDTFVITTTDAQGQSTDRVLVRNVSEGRLYASVNHWPRRWYYQVLENPSVHITIDGISGQYLAVEVDETEFERVDADNPHGLIFHALTGFAPRRILRLDPQ